MPEIPSFIYDEVQKTLNMQKWTFAKTMPWIPHFYTVQRWWTPGSPIEHRDILRVISEHGTVLAWGKKKVLRLYLDVPDPATGTTWRYWHMGECSPEAWRDKTIDTINRQDIAINTCVPVITKPPETFQHSLL
jgi:hypothetical protein